MQVTLTMTDGSEQVLRLSLSQCQTMKADLAFYVCGGVPTWGQYRDLTGKVHHLEFAQIVVWNVAVLPTEAVHPIWGRDP